MKKPRETPASFTTERPRRAPARAKIAACRRLVAFVRDEDGGPLVEFTILTPIIFLVIFGIVEWGNIYFIQNSMFIAARLAAREAAVQTIANTRLGAATAACASPSPIAGTGYTYTFTYASNVGCPSGPYPLSSASVPSWGTVTMTIATPAATVATFDYKGLIGGTLSASATMEQEYTCYAAPSTSSCTATCATVSTSC